MYEWNFGTHDTILVILYKINKHVGGTLIKNCSQINEIYIYPGDYV